MEKRDFLKLKIEDGMILKKKKERKKQFSSFSFKTKLAFPFEFQ